MHKRMVSGLTDDEIEFWGYPPTDPEDTTWQILLEDEATEWLVEHCGRALYSPDNMCYIGQI